MTGKRVLLHACCAPCCASIIKRLSDSGFEVTVFFYNPNVYPREEYAKRKQEVIRYAGKNRIFFVDGDYDPDRWFEWTKGYDESPERGERCGLCFDMRLKKTAAYAAENEFQVFTSSLGISRWKDFDQVTRSGKKAASLFPGTIYCDINWRKDGGIELMSRITHEEKFYRQDYCGCLYSLESYKQKAQNLNHGKVFPPASSIL